MNHAAIIHKNLTLKTSLNFEVGLSGQENMDMREPRGGKSHRRFHTTRKISGRGVFMSMIYIESCVQSY